MILQCTPAWCQLAKVKIPQGKATLVDKFVDNMITLQFSYEDNQKIIFNCIVRVVGVSICVSDFAVAHIILSFVSSIL
jgi:hypothetical protein